MRAIEKPWLIQRLEKPFKLPESANPVFKAMAKGAAGPFSFGGGYVNGGLTKEANEMLGQVFRFDYMGSAEFEYGAVPKALAGLAKEADNLVAFEIQIDMKDVEPNWRRKYPELDKKGKKKVYAPKATGSKPVYILCRKDVKDQVEEVVRQLAKKESSTSLKESCGLSSVLDAVEDFQRRTQGWLEIDHGYFFFTDKEMYEGTVALFKGNQ